MGEDNLRTLHKWYNADEIVNNHSIYVYPRVLTVQEMKNEADKKSGTSECLSLT